MSGTRITNIELSQKTNFNFRFLKIFALGFGVFSLLNVSACTSSNSSPSVIARPTLEEALSSAASNAATTETESTLTSQLQSPSQSQASVPVPNISPKFQTSLLAEVESTNNTLASSDIIAKEINTGTASAEKSITVPIASPIASPTQPNKSTNRVTILKNAQIASHGSANPNISITALKTASILKNEPKRKLNFFERLLKSRRDRNAANKLATHKSTLDAEILKLAKANTDTISTNVASGNNGLQLGTEPGVKEGIKLLEIEEEEANHDDDTNVEVASVGALGRTAGPHGLILQTQGVQVACLKPKLLAVLKKVERHFGKKVMVTSGYRSPARNRRAGGVKNSHHTTCNAADIQVAGISKWIIAKYLRTIDGRGGVGTYCRTKSVHIDIGSQRDWHQPCRRRKRRK